jgi:hypothetical protein
MESVSISSSKADEKVGEKSPRHLICFANLSRLKRKGMPYTVQIIQHVQATSMVLHK